MPEGGRRVEEESEIRLKVGLGLAGEGARMLGSGV